MTTTKSTHVEFAVGSNVRQKTLAFMTEKGYMPSIEIGLLYAVYIYTFECADVHKKTVVQGSATNGQVLPV